MAIGGSMRGYSQIVIEANQSAEPSLGVKLGAVCIQKKYSVIKLAERLKISRQAIYDWFTGKSKPAKNKEDLVTQLIQEIETL